MGITRQLKQEIIERLQQIEKNKVFWEREYHDYGLLICHDNGDPIETRLMTGFFDKWQDEVGIENKIAMKGFRKSAQMYKSRLYGNISGTSKIVAHLAGHSDKVLHAHYEITIEDIHFYIKVFENNFYRQPERNTAIDKNMKDTKIVDNLDAIKELFKGLLIPDTDNSAYNRDGVEIDFVKALTGVIELDSSKAIDALVVYHKHREELLSKK